jgi:hypothetical protein
MDKHIFRSFVFADTSYDDYDDAITHIAVELQPGAILRLVYTSLVA